MGFYIERFTNMETREFEVEVVTPLFLGGSDPAKAELRFPPIKGLIRFWWRALYGSDDLKEMKEREERIFGSTNCKSTLSILLRKAENIIPVKKNLNKGTEFKVKNFKLGIIDYLAFGLRENRQGYNKEHIEPGNHFSINLQVKKENADQVFNSLDHLIHFGGLGAKSRNGFGSLALKNCQIPELNNQYEVKEFTSYSNKTKLFTNFNKHNDWIAALSEIGLAYRIARMEINKSKRLLIAKPIVQLGNNERHSKPYFLHVNKRPDGKYQGQILFMPYNYHDSSKRKEYFEVCEKMNQIIAQLTGGPK